MSLIAIFPDVYVALTGSAVKRIHPVIRLKAEQPGCYDLIFSIIRFSSIY